MEHIDFMNAVAGAHGESDIASAFQAIVAEEEQDQVTIEKRREDGGHDYVVRVSDQFSGVLRIIRRVSYVFEFDGGESFTHEEDRHYSGDSAEACLSAMMRATDDCRRGKPLD